MDNNKYWSNFKAADYIDISCFKCGKSSNKKINSIRVNIKRNGNYLCHKCIVTFNNKNKVADKLRSRRSMNKEPRLDDLFKAICK